MDLLSPEDTRQILLSRPQIADLSRQLVDDAEAKLRASGETDEAVFRLIRLWSEKLLAQSFDRVFRFSESPIETLFLNSLIVMSFFESAFFLLFTPKFDSISETLKYTRERSDAIASALKQFKDATGLGDREFLETIKSSPDIPIDWKQWTDMEVILIRGLKLNDRFHLSMQSTLQEMKVEGRVIRPDAFIWVPTRPDFKLIVECDGYQFHSDKAAFTRDRKRDRLLHAGGFDVLRYSGGEIWSNPAEVALDLLGHLKQAGQRLGLDVEG